MAGATSGGGTGNPPGAPEFTVTFIQEHRSSDMKIVLDTSLGK
jgi:hypothetical protein